VPHSGQNLNVGCDSKPQFAQTAIEPV